MILDKLKYHFVSFVWVLGSLIPLRVMYVISDILYYPFYYLIRYRRKVAHKNLVDCFPEKSAKEIARIEKRFYRFFLDNVFEVCKLASISKKTMCKRMIFDNTDEINDLLQQGKSISLYLGHYGNWEWVSSIPLHLKGNVIAGQIYRKLSSPLSDKLFLRNRSRMGAVSVEMDHTLRWVKEHVDNKVTTITGYIADQSPRRGETKHFANFLNHYTPVQIGAEKITKRYKMEAFYLDVVREKRGYYKATFVKMADDTSSLPEMKLTEIYYNYLEKTIRRQPEFYLWTHRRFKRAQKL